VPEHTREYREVLLRIREIIDRYDPEGLLAMGSPEDEYEPEAHDLVRFVLGTQEPTRESVDFVWHRWFSVDLQPDVADAINNDLHRLRAAIPEP
jgi:hypothetical protein